MKNNEFKTEQENFWVNEFGKNYIERNNSKYDLATNLFTFSNIFNSREKISSVIEFGANIGMNLIAIKQLLPDVEIEAVEIFQEAYKKLVNLEFVNGYNQSIFDFEPSKKYDFVLIKGVLIHINPEYLEIVYSKLYESSQKYICIAEYYNPFPVEVNYRGNNEKLYKRDFAGEFLKKYPDCRIVDYGFTYRNDENFSHDDITWFLIKK